MWLYHFSQSSHCVVAPCQWKRCRRANGSGAGVPRRRGSSGWMGCGEPFLASVARAVARTCRLLATGYLTLGAREGDLELPAPRCLCWGSWKRGRALALVGTAWVGCNWAGPARCPQYHPDIPLGSSVEVKRKLGCPWAGVCNPVLQRECFLPHRCSCQRWCVSSITRWLRVSPLGSPWLCLTGSLLWLVIPWVETRGSAEQCFV